MGRSRAWEFTETQGSNGMRAGIILTVKVVHCRSDMVGEESSGQIRPTPKPSSIPKSHNTYQGTDGMHVGNELDYLLLTEMDLFYLVNLIPHSSIICTQIRLF